MPQAPTDYNEIRRIAITAIFSDDVLFERVVLKGGNALSLALGLSRRTSLDLDFSIENDFEDLDDIRARLSKALEDRFRAAGLRVFDFKLEPKPSVARAGQDPRWGGYLASFKLAEREKFEHVNSDLAALRRDSLVIGPNQQRAFTIDLSKYEYITGKLEVELDNYTIYVYSPAMIAIEKLRAICQQMPEYTMQRNPSARARDFYDIHLIMSATGMDLTAPDKIELLRNIFAAKKVPLRLLGRIKDQREFHRPDWDSVRVSSKGENLGEFDTYFDSVVRLTHSMKTFWEE
jgi:predicted nucleotidyltransferase component of viral defense system